MAWRRVRSRTPAGDRPVWEQSERARVEGRPPHAQRSTRARGNSEISQTRCAESRLAASRDGSKLYTGSYYGQVSEWNLTTGRLERIFGSPSGLDMAVSPDGGLMISPGGHKGSVLDMAVSPDGRWLITFGDDYRLFLWNTITGKVHTSRSTIDAPFRGPASVVRSLAFSPNGRLILTGSIDSQAKADLWEVPSLNHFLTLRGHENTVATTAFSIDGKLALTGGGNPDKTAILWDVNTGALIETLRGHTSGVVAAAFSPHGESFVTVTADLRLNFWEGVESPKLRSSSQLPLPQGLSWASYIAGPRVSFQPQTGGLLATTSYDVAALWSVEQLKQGSSAPVRILRGHSMPISSATFTADGSFLVTGGADAVIFWDRSTGAELRRLINSGDDQWLVICRDGRFDSGNLDKNRGLAWTFRDDPLRALPPEIFSRDYFEPRLLPRLLVGEQFSGPASSLERLNRVQAGVADPAIRAEGDTARVALRVRATGNRDTFGEGDDRREMATDAYDLRLCATASSSGNFPAPIETRTAT